MSLACRRRYRTESTARNEARLRERLPSSREFWFAVPHDTVMISDGGLATELEARGHDLSDALWSARLLVDAPLEIVAAHVAFFRAGAALATTASYQASFEGFAARGIDWAQAARLLRRSVDLAQTACAEVRRRRRWVAASIGPYGAALADGSEYRGRYGLSVAKLTRLAPATTGRSGDAGPDVLALETIPDVDEAEALVRLVAQLGMPAWLSYTIDGTADPRRSAAGGCLRGRRRGNGDRRGRRELLRAGRRAARYRRRRRNHRQAGDRLSQQRRGWDAERRAWVGRSHFSAELAPQWVAAGAGIVGGCCRVRPADIADIAVRSREVAQAVCCAESLRYSSTVSMMP